MGGTCAFIISLEVQGAQKKGTKEGKFPGILEYKALPKQWPFQVFGIASFFLPIQRYFRQNPSNHYEGVELIQQQQDAMNHCDFFSHRLTLQGTRKHIPPNGKSKIIDSKVPLKGDMLVTRRLFQNQGPSKKAKPSPKIHFGFLRLNWPIFKAIFGESKSYPEGRRGGPKKGANWEPYIVFLENLRKTIGNYREDWGWNPGLTHILFVLRIP